MADTKEHAHELIDRLPPTQLSAVVGLLEAILEPVSPGEVPVEEEEISSETAAALQRSRASLARGEAFHTKKFYVSSVSRNDRRACGSAWPSFGRRRLVTTSAPSTANPRCRFSTALIGTLPAVPVK
jgi:hypothetical protein